MEEDKKLTIAIDFDGTLCENKFPEIGEQNEDQIMLLEKLIKMRENGHKIILYTCRGDNEKYKCLSESVEWCKQKGLEFDAINENIAGFVKKSGYSPKPVADIYIDDRAINVKEWRKIDDFQ